jgi:hypothetical protein
MAEIKHIIEPERMGLWVAVTFVIALLALITAVTAVNRVFVLAEVSQAEVVLLKNQINELKGAGNAPAPAAEAETK